LGEKSLLSFYFAPVGDPAIGPTAYPHRASAFEDTVGTLGHHQEDSTHIADDVVTLGLTYRDVRVEASGFHGREPDEFRWDIDQGKIDSWSTRLTVQPGKNWSGQYSYARIKSPEALSRLKIKSA
jgi:outer membrane receptor protein involved in Fe transport